jgi:hypothetical protein
VFISGRARRWRLRAISGWWLRPAYPQNSRS